MLPAPETKLGDCPQHGLTEWRRRAKSDSHYKPGWRWVPWYCAECRREYDATYKIQMRARYKAEANERYGPGCQLCGEQRLVFLCVDHVGGGGNAHRREIGSGSRILWWLRDRGYPPGFRLLCHSCNHAVVVGACPHARTE